MRKPRIAILGATGVVGREITKISEDKKQNYSGTITLSNKNFDKENDLNYYFRYDARESNSPLVEYPY